MTTKLKVQYQPIDSVTPYANNARTHNREQIQQLAKSIEAFGFINPVLIDTEGVLVAGHARVLAAQKIGLKVIPTICVEHLSEAEKRAYILADNRLAESAGWDQDLLKVELEYLSSADMEFSADLTGFSTTDIDLILGNDSVPSSDDELPPFPDINDTISRLGDIWCLGPHRVLVGDCREASSVDLLMEDKQAKMVISDVPYNVPISGHVSGLGKTQHREFQIASGELSPEEFTQFLTDALNQFYRTAVDGSLHYVFIDWRHLPELLAAGTAVYDSHENLCVWAKTNAGMGSLYRSQHELILLFKKGTASHINNVELGKNGRYRSNLWTYAGMNSFGAERDKNITMHPTVKPVQLLADAILDVTRPGDIVTDFFLGSGSTLIAAERTNRICYGIELDPGYVDITIARWEQSSGLQATLQGTDLTTDQVAIQRSAGREVTA